MNQLITLRNVVTLKLGLRECVGCGMCLIVCPHVVFRLTNVTAETINRDACMERDGYLRNCPAEPMIVQWGVGCAAAVINSKLDRKKES